MTALPVQLSVRTIDAATHLAFVRAQRSASFLQTPGWAAVKSEWRAESLGWFRAGEEAPAGVALVLHRSLPKIGRTLAYLPEGPVIDWDDADLGAWLTPLAAHLKAGGAFGIRIGPPVVTRRWTAAVVKEGIADEAVTTLTALAPSERSTTGARVVSQLRELGWVTQSVAGGFAAGQPQFNFQIPLRTADGEPRSEEDVLAGMNQLWRRNIKKAAKAGLEVTSVGADATPADIAAFHSLYAETATRDHFTPRPLAYFTTMVRALGAEDPDRVRLYFGRHEGDLVAATLLIRVGGHVWYSYGASSSAKREVRGSNAVQWQMIRDALAAGADVYDLRGITDTLASDDAHVGLIQFKVGTGGEAVEYAGEWDLPLNRLLYKAFDTYMKRR
ncbi:MAG: peptidoglycan bridge formation glycyltransferase FemA/FemB family protein [Nocardioidaceae bacterium]|nr:peptidoglycan bridge formation glycyltransferase FemA/FemB family protein [Nocardioidaceae bacterium]